MTKRILPDAVRKREGRKIKDKSPPWSPRKYHATLVIGSRMSGKSNCLAWCLLNGWSKNYKNVILLSPSVTFDKTWTAIEHLDNVLVSDQCDDAILNDILESQKQLVKKSRKNDLLLIIDDFASILRSKGGPSKVLDKIFSTGRHYSMSVVLTSQYLNFVSPACRMNATNLIVYRLNDKEYAKLAEEYRMFLTDKEFIKKAIDATKRRFSFFYIDCQTEDIDKVFNEGFHD